MPYHIGNVALQTHISDNNLDFDVILNEIYCHAQAYLNSYASLDGAFHLTKPTDPMEIRNNFDIDTKNIDT